MICCACGDSKDLQTPHISCLICLRDLHYACAYIFGLDGHLSAVCPSQACIVTVRLRGGALVDDPTVDVRKRRGLPPSDLL